MTGSKALEDLIHGPAEPRMPATLTELLSGDDFGWDYKAAISNAAGMLRAARLQEKSAGFDVSMLSGGSLSEEVVLVGTDDSRQVLIVTGSGPRHVLTPVAVGSMRSLFEGSAASSAEATLSRLVQSDAERLWANGIVALEEENVESVKAEFNLFLKRHGEAGVRALSRLVLGSLPSGQVAWTYLQMLGESVDRDTARARRDVLSAALESRDAGLRYAAATALGDFGGPEAVGALRKRLDWEKNISVRRVIEAELRK